LQATSAAEWRSTALASFAEKYADQNERDYASLKTAAAAGRIEVKSGL
jgi:hypothetical protein